MALNYSATFFFLNDCYVPVTEIDVLGTTVINSESSSLCGVYYLFKKMHVK